jgi:hypothetical protein
MPPGENHLHSSEKNGEIFPTALRTDWMTSTASWALFSRLLRIDPGDDWSGKEKN